MGNGAFVRTIKIIFITLLFFTITNYVGMACGQHSDQVEEVNATCTPTAPIVKNFVASNESAYCNTTQTYANSVTVTSTAEFNVRQISGAGFGAEVTGGPIAYAEVQVLNQSQNIIQCAQTGANGEISFTVPKNLTGLTLRVNSRADNNFLKTSILNNPTEDLFYSLAINFNSGSANSLTLPTLTASAGATGGAFNILANVLRANEALRFFSPSFTVAPKSIVYWTKGFNPYVYTGGSSNDGVSFYILGSGRLYILGGINGDVDSSDHDHFDDAIISHEYGHFIEDAFSKTDSPGGIHNGNNIIDARLAWGEGWANFFSSAVRANKMYRDCYGTSNGTTGCFLNYNIDTNQPSIDVPINSGEGNFREFAITRALWDSVDPIRNIASGPTSGNNDPLDLQNGQDTVTQSFGNFWGTFSGIFASNNEYFRSIGKLLLLNNDPALNGSNVFNADKVLANTKDYAQPLPTTTGAGCSGTSIPIFANDVSSVVINSKTLCVRGNLHHLCSNQLASNDFYDVYYDGSFSSVSIIRTAGTAELGLYLYRTPYNFGNSCDIIAQSALGSGATKTVSFDGLAFGHYMLNVNVYTGNGNPTAQSNYQIFVNSNQVCP